MAKAPTAQAGRFNPVNRLQGFLQEVKLEMEKVAWPSKDELKSQTSIVLMLLFFLAVIIGVFDKICEIVMMLLFRFLA